MKTTPATLKDTLQGPTLHEDWERSYRTPLSEQFYDRAFEWICGELSLPYGSHFLDIGCGIGSHSLRLSRHGYVLTAADFSPDRVQSARKNFESSAKPSCNVRVVEEDLQAGLSFATGQFDGVLCWGVLMHVSQIEKAMNELVRVVRPGGAIVIGEANLFSFDGAASLVMAAVKGLMRKSKRSAAQWGPYGMEYVVETKAGHLLVRHSRIRAIIRYLESNGCRLQRRGAGQFTESFTRLESYGWAPVAHALNHAWFSTVKSPYLAYGNIVILRR